MKELLSMGLRLLTLLGKFILITIMTKFISLDSVGVYGVIISIISLSVYLSGFEVYGFFVNRYNASKLKDSVVFSNQICLSLCGALVFSSVSTLYLFEFSPVLVPLYVVLIILFIVVSEVLLQEFHRLFLVIDKCFLANVILFFRNGLWCYTSCFLFFFNYTDKDSYLFLILLSWLICNLFCVLFSFKAVKNADINLSFKYMKIVYILSSLRSALPIFISSILVRMVVSLDRVILSYFVELRVVGIYTFFISISNAGQALLDAGFISTKYVSIVAYAKKNDMKSIANLLHYSLLKAGFLFFVLFILSFVFFGLTGMNAHLNYIYALAIILFAGVLQSISVISKLCLIATDYRNLVFKSGLTSFAVFFCSYFPLCYFYKHSIYIVSIFLFFSSFVYFLSQWVYIKKIAWE